jgi:molybdopterin synthase catalytic subunit
MPVRLSEAAFDAWQTLQDYQSGQNALRGKYGATAVFVGTMRDFNQGDDVQSLWLEHYPGMTETELQRIVDEAQRQWPLLDSLLVHRVGAVQPDQVLVLVAVWSAHRAAAFDASRYMMEMLKSRAPFWKRETLADGSQRWVEKNTPA